LVCAQHSRDQKGRRAGKNRKIPAPKGSRKRRSFRGASEQAQTGLRAEKDSSETKDNSGVIGVAILTVILTFGFYKTQNERESRVDIGWN
jgi:hypothetical protein